MVNTSRSDLKHFINIILNIPINSPNFIVAIHSLLMHFLYITTIIVVVSQIAPVFLENTPSD